MEETIRDQKNIIDILKIKLDKANSNPDVFENLHYKTLQNELIEYKENAVKSYQELSQALEKEKIDKTEAYKMNKNYQEALEKIKEFEEDIQGLNDKLQEKELSKKQ